MNTKKVVTSPQFALQTTSLSKALLNGSNESSPSHNQNSSASGLKLQHHRGIIIDNLNAIYKNQSPHDMV